MPGTGASIITSFFTRAGYWMTKAKATMFPMSWATTSTRSTLSASSTPATSLPCVFFS
jgi:hypothetical protein